MSNNKKNNKEQKLESAKEKKSNISSSQKKQKKKNIEQIKNSIMKELNPQSKREKELVEALFSKINKYDSIKSFISNIDRELTESFNSIISSSVFKRDYNNNSLSLINASLTHKVAQIKSVFPEIEYLEELIASLSIFNSESKLGLKSSPGVLYSIILKPKLKEAISQLEGATSIKDIPDTTRMTDTLLYAIREELHELIEINDTHFQLIEAIKSLIENGCFVVNFSEDFKYFTIFNLDDISIENANNKNIDSKIRNLTNIGIPLFSSKLNASDSENLESESSLFTPIKDLYKEMEIIVKTKSGDILDVNRTYIVSNSPRRIFGKSKFEKIFKYCQILYTLEIANMLERLSKSKLINLIFIDISDLDDADAVAYTSLYSNIIKNKLAINISSEGEESQGFDMLKSIIDNIAVLPIEGKDKVKIDQIKSEYKPIYQDIDYYQEKIYSTLGIPVFYRTNPAEMKSIPKESLKIHDIAFSATIMQYQSYMNKFLTEQFKLYFEHKGFEIYYISVAIPKFVPVSMEKESDIQRIEKFVKIAIDIQNLLGITLKKSFILSYVFPEYHPSDIAEEFEEEKQNIGFYSMDDLKKLGLTEEQLQQIQPQEEEDTNQLESSSDISSDIDSEQEYQLEPDSIESAKSKKSKLKKNREDSNIFDLLGEASSAKEIKQELKPIIGLYRKLYETLNSEYISNTDRTLLEQKLNALSKYINSILSKKQTISDVGYLPFI